MLALILVQPLDENIEHRVRIDLNPLLIVNICRELRLVVPLDDSPNDGARPTGWTAPVAGEERCGNGIESYAASCG